MSHDYGDSPPRIKCPLSFAPDRVTIGDLYVRNQTVEDLRVPESQDLENYKSSDRSNSEGN